MSKTELYPAIIATSRYLPERIMTNFDLEKMIDTTDEWIVQKIGVRQRHIASEEEATSDLGYKASKKVLEKAEVSPCDLDLIIVATSTPDMIFPSTACIIQAKLGAVNATAFDLGAVCSGFIYALSIAVNQMIADLNFKTVLVIGAETCSRILNWSDRKTCVIFGDGAGAALLKNRIKKRSLLSSALLSDGDGYDLIKIPAGGSRLPASHETVEKRLHCFHMDGRAVFDFAVEGFPKVIQCALRKSGLSIKDVNLVIPHQANINILTQGMQKLGLPMERVFLNIDKYGNTAAASVPIALDEAIEQGKVKENDILVMSGVGAGLTLGAIVWQW